MNKCKFNEGSNFDRQGQWVIAKYLDTCMIAGVIQETRIKYGGSIQHKIISDLPTHIRDEVRAIGTVFLIEEKDIEHCEFVAEAVL